MTDTVVNKSDGSPQQAATLSEGMWFKTLNHIPSDNVAAWTVAIPIEILRFSVGVSLTAASYIPVVFMGLIGTFISECGNVCPTPSPGLHS